MAQDPKTNARLPSNNREAGVALIVVLWIVAIGTMLVAAFNATVRSGIAFVSSEVQLSRADWLLDAGLEIAATRLIDNAGRWLPDGKTKAVPFGGTTLKIRIDNPNGLIDLNKTPDDVLLEFFSAFADNPGAAKQIVAGIAAASNPETRGGALQSETEAPSGDADVMPFVDIGQLRDIPGMTMPLFRRIQPFVTVYSIDGAISAEASPPDLLAVLKRANGAASTSTRSAGSSGSDDDDAKLGPAYIVSVQAPAPNGRYTSGKTYVIAVGLDENRPYRLLSVSPTMMPRI